MPNHCVKESIVSLIENGTIVTPYRVVEHGSILVEDGRIAEVGGKTEGLSAKGRKESILDASNKVVIPGMIDIHTHGLAGASVFDCSVGSIRRMAMSFPRYGVTSFLPTTAAESQQMLLQTADCIAQLMEGQGSSNEAQVLGMNLEGPFISKAKPGAQLAGFIRDPDYQEFIRIHEHSGEAVRLITVAPELNGALELINRVKKKGITIAAGHSNATYQEMIAGIEAGITHASHMYNAMRDFKHRDPGIIAAILLRDDVSAELIADNVHVHEAAMRLLVKAKGTENLVLVSDSMPFAGMQDGNYDMMGFKIRLKDGAITLPNGQLAGSAATLDRCLRTAVNQLGIPLQEAVKMLTVNPARVIRVATYKGSIDAGKDADMVLLNREDLTIYATIIKGRLVYRRTTNL